VSEDVPDDLSELDEPVTVALLVTQVAEAEPLAAVCSLAGVQADVVASGVGAMAVLRDPRAGAAAAAGVSRLLAGTQLVLLERRAGAIAATTWSGGTQGEDVAPGLVLAEGPTLLEDLLLGDLAAAEVDGAVASTGISRFKALRLLTRVGRRGRTSS
jgi:hypothetical protein